MSLIVKMVDGTQKSVDVPDLDITAAALKERMADVVGIPTQEQRVVVRGKVLKDTDVLRAIGVEHGHAVHVVRAKRVSAPAATTPPASSSETTTTAPSPAAATTVSSAAPATTPATPPANPYAGLMSGMFATPQQQQASASPASALGAFGGLPGAGGMNADASMQLLRTPGALEMVSHLAENPQFMEQMAQMNPNYASMPPETRQMMLQLMRNPEALRSMLSVFGGADAGAGAGAGGDASGGLGAMPGLFMPPTAAAPPPVGNPREVYREQLAQLRDMGFPNEEANIAALQQAQGNIHFAIERLFSA